VRSRLAFAFAVALFLPTIALAAPEIRVVPSSPRPGEVIFVTLHVGKELTRAACSWNRKSYSFLPDEGVYRVLLPVPAGLRAGGHHATVYWRYADGECGKGTLPIQVKPRQFGVQRLKLSASQEKKYDAPDTAREYALIGAALDLVTEERSWQGPFLMPVQGRISTSYGLQRYVNGRFDYRHKGVDIAAPLGTPVKAAAAGVVSLADASFQLHGQTLILDHGQGVSTLYLHLSEIHVAPGESVAPGQTIGLAGESGVATGPHLHYGVYVYHEAVDPLYWTRLPEF
jgi:murein DD-endopeptidase MepM/ murein hydrolase activator NlpD